MSFIGGSNVNVTIDLSNQGGPRALHRYSYQYLPENFKGITDQYGPFGSCAVVGCGPPPRRPTEAEPGR